MVLVGIEDSPENVAVVVNANVVDEDEDKLAVVLSLHAPIFHCSLRREPSSPLG